MNKKNIIKINDIDLIVFDFDGVLTDNKLYISQNGQESVRCSRSDGLAFDILRKLNAKSIIISSEKNLVVTERAKKLKIPAIQASMNKSKTLQDFSNNNNYDLKKIIFVGNDLNDYQAMQLCGFSICPSDSHPEIKKIANIVLKSKGGSGVVRELLEEVFEIDCLKILFN